VGFFFAEEVSHVASFRFLSTHVLEGIVIRSGIDGKRYKRKSIHSDTSNKVLQTFYAPLIYSPNFRRLSAKMRIHLNPYEILVVEYRQLF